MALNTTYIDLDAVTPANVEIAKTVDGTLRVWHLQDTIPTEILLSVFELMEHAKERAKLPADVALIADENERKAAEMHAMKTALTGYVEETLAVFVEIWRYNNLIETPDELRRFFNHEQREDLVKLFFTRRLSALGERSNATADTIPMTETMSQRETTPSSPNRAMRRSKTSPQGAIPSQKRLRREMQGL